MGLSSQKLWALFLVLFIVGVYTGVVPIGEAYRTKVSIGVFLALIFMGVSVAGEQGRRNRFQRQTAQAYARQYPGHVRDGVVSCHACECTEHQAREIQGSTEYKALMCERCNNVLYYTR